MIVTEQEKAARRELARVAPSVGLTALTPDQVAVLARGALTGARSVQRPGDPQRGGTQPEPRRASRPPMPELAPQDVAVLRLMALGLSNAAIAKHRRVPAGVVGTQVRRLYEALGADGRAQAVALGYELGLLRAGGAS
jgi:DNA-binding NarL/FixJ family response regulator